MTRMIRCFCAAAALLTLTALTPVAYADGRDYNDGSVVNVAAIRTVDGHFDEYMHWLATTYKKLLDAQKKAGLILSYQVMIVEPRGPHDPDIYLITEYKNWAALDGLGHKTDAVTAEVIGSLEQADHATVEREKIRTVLGSQTMQAALLK
jgi:hypothetical protein